LRWWARSGGPTIILSADAIEPTKGAAARVAHYDPDTSTLAFNATVMGAIGDVREAAIGVIVHELLHAVADVCGASFSSIADEEEAIDLAAAVLDVWPRRRIDPILDGAIEGWAHGRPITFDPLLWPEDLAPPKQLTREATRARREAHIATVAKSAPTKKRKHTTTKEK
jgi:hypothetical protein